MKVSLPHTWNALDGADGGNDYARLACEYQRNLRISPAMTGKTLVLRFEGANRQTQATINGSPVGTHLGGFAAFAFDITKFVHPGDNTLSIRVSNAKFNSPPISADFTFFGGIYRPAELLILDPLHISATDYASPGVAIQTPEITDTSASVSVRTLIENDLAASQNASVNVQIVDAAGAEVGRATTPISIGAGATIPATTTLSITNPHRWNGRKDPYLYQVRINIMRDGRLVDSTTQPLGIRTFSIDKDKGFMLNGQSYPLHGVNRHQDRPNKGWAISNADHDEDMKLILEMGCNAIRLAHYQHSEYFYELCDKAGLIVWAEVPVVNEITQTQEFTDNAEQQLRELIRQNINHPSICFWSLGNEIGTKGGNPTTLLKAMNVVAHHEDPSRMTTVAFADKNREWPGITDTAGKNRYYGWYNGEIGDFAKFVVGEKSEAISEYGAGASIYFHSEHPTKMDHTEEYQCTLHEAQFAAMEKTPQIWGTFLWNMFDFASDGRAEGDHAGINDKGLVTYDRTTRKDVFYYYKAKWTQEPMVHINSKRFDVRGLDKIQVKAYTNAPTLELWVNGVSRGSRSADNATCIWQNVPLKEGKNQVIAHGTLNGKPIEDHCDWTYKPGAPTEVYIPQDDRMKEALKKAAPRCSPSRNPPSPCRLPQPMLSHTNPHRVNDKKGGGPHRDPPPENSPITQQLMPSGDAPAEHPHPRPECPGSSAPASPWEMPHPRVPQRTPQYWHPTALRCPSGSTHHSNRSGRWPAPHQSYP